MCFLIRFFLSSGYLNFVKFCVTYRISAIFSTLRRSAMSTRHAGTSGSAGPASRVATCLRRIEVKRAWPMPEPVPHDYLNKTLAEAATA